MNNRALRDAIAHIDVTARMVVAACSEGDTLRTNLVVLRPFAKYETPPDRAASAHRRTVYRFVVVPLRRHLENRAAARAAEIAVLIAAVHGAAEEHTTRGERQASLGVRTIVRLYLQVP
jgi:hypothetical protein